MALSDDSPPFAVLQQNAEDFKSAFDADITKCLTALNSKITALMCDPDSIGGATGEAKRGNAHVEFSMAKYGILGSMRALYEETEKAWLDRLEDMKEEFIENVELFLANTKLEVKLPALGVSPRVGIRKSTSSFNVAKQDIKSPSTVSSIYPKLFNTAKNIPGLSSLLPKDEDEEESSEEEELQPAPVITSKPRGRTPKKVTIAEQYIPPPGQNGVSRRRGNQATPKVSLPVNNDVEESEDEEEEPVVVQTPIKKSGRGRKPTVNTPVSAKKETVNTPLRRKIASKKETDSDSTSSNEEKAAPLDDTGRRGRRSVMAQPAVGTGSKAINSTPSKRGRPSKKKAVEKEAQYQPDDAMEITEVAYEPAASGPKTPKQVHFSLGLDPNEDLDIYSPDMTISRAVPRRKTMVTQALDNFSDICLTPEFTRGKSKRKTFAGSDLDQSVAPSPKRLKTGRSRSSLSAVGHYETMDTNLLESDGASEMGKYSPWIPLSDIGGTVPALPGIYELKVAQAKKPAYIGACDSLRQKLTLHKLAQNSGHKHLDKFIDRNGANVLVRYEQMMSAQEAKVEEKNRVKNFVACYKTTPAYN